MARNEEFLSQLSFEVQEANDKSPHRITAKRGKDFVGHFHWGNNDGGSVIKDIWVEPDFQRIGVATSMLEQARQFAKERDLPEPLHHSQRTDAGDAWAKKVGGELPKREPYSRTHGLPYEH